MKSPQGWMIAGLSRCTSIQRGFDLADKHFGIDMLSVTREQKIADKFGTCPQSHPLRPNYSSLTLRWKSILEGAFDHT